MTSINTKSDYVIVFLGKMSSVIPGMLFVVWEGLASHRSRVIQEHLATGMRRIEIVGFPFAPRT